MELSPTIFSLESDHVRSILARNNVGRIAFAQAGEVEIRPLNYVFHGDRIYGRTMPSALISEAAAMHTRVAFEVDEIDSVFRWKSVIIKGEMRPLTPDGPDADEWKEAAALLTRVVRRALADGDPVPERTTIIRISVDSLSGRASVVRMQGSVVRA